MSRRLNYSRARNSSIWRSHELTALKFYSQYCSPHANIIPTQLPSPRQLGGISPRSRHTTSSANQSTVRWSSGFTTAGPAHGLGFRSLNLGCQVLSNKLHSAPSDSERNWRSESCTGYGIPSRNSRLSQGHRVQELSTVASRGQEKEAEEDEGDNGIALLKDRAEALLTSVSHPKDLLDAESNRYLILSDAVQNQYLPEGLPPSMTAEFDVSGCGGVLIRDVATDLIRKMMSVNAETQQAGVGLGEGVGEGEGSLRREGGAEMEAAAAAAPKPRRKHFLLEGPPGSGKSFALAQAVLWARSNGWLVLYVPCARDWTRGGLYYPYKDTPLFDTPVQAKTVLQGFLASNKDLLPTLPIQIFDPLDLGEGPGTGPPKGPHLKSVGVEGGISTLHDLVDFGIKNGHGAVSAVVRLREELARVKTVPVLIAVDEFNAWFTFSSYNVSEGPQVRKRYPIHARDVRMVNAFRSMVGPSSVEAPRGIFLAAMSESIAVGKLAPKLPGVPQRCRFQMTRYSPKEAWTTMLFYQSRSKLGERTPSGKIPMLDGEAMKRLYYLTNGNGVEIRKMVSLVPSL